MAANDRQIKAKKIQKEIIKIERKLNDLYKKKEAIERPKIGFNYKNRNV